MPLPDRWQDAAAPCTVSSLSAEFSALGVLPGSTLLVHASLSSLGWVCGGATAVVVALLTALGPHGTLVVPTMTPQNRDPSRWTDPAVPEAWWPVIRDTLPPFDPAVSPSQRMGAVAEQVRTWPGAVRSVHPQTSFAAVGPAAAIVVHDHDFACHLGERSPLARLEAQDSHVLLLGVGFERCSCFHLAEYRQASPPRRVYACVIANDATEGGRPDRARGRWFTYEDVYLRDDDFGRLGRAFEDTSDDVRTRQVGQATARLFPLRAAVAFATTWIREQRSPET